MVKTRSQTSNIIIKKEEEDCKPSLRLGSIRNTRTSSRIAKRKPSIIDNRPVSAQQVKLEEDTDNKLLVRSIANYSKSEKNQYISQEQINQLVGYIVNNNMAIARASRKANISVTSGFTYYKMYANDPEKKIPLPRVQNLKNTRNYTQKHVENLIRYINQDKMSVAQAAAKANMATSSSRRYYKRYLEDPNHAIPIALLRHKYKQGQKNEFIDYIINDKMSILAASKKAKINTLTAYSYCRRYFKVQNPDIPTPGHITTPRYYTQEQIKEVIGYIVKDKMTIVAASKKANVHRVTAGKYYRQYKKDNNIEIPASKMGKRYTQDEINELIRYVVVDKMSMTAASKKANMSTPTGIKYYREYLKDHHLGSPIQNDITQEQNSELIRYIVDNKMSIKAASKKANMSRKTGHKYYQRIKRQSAPT